MDVTITIPNDKLALIAKAFEAEFPDRPEEITQAGWVKLQTLEFIRRTVWAHEAKNNPTPKTDISLS